MNCKHLRKISVAHENIFTRELGKSPNLQHHHGYDTEHPVSERTLNAPKNVQFYRPKCFLPCKGDHRSDICKSPEFGLTIYQPPFRCDQKRNYSSLIEKLKNFLMSVFNSNSVPLIKAGEQVEPNKDQETKKSKKSALSPTVAPGTSPPLPSVLQSQSSPKSKPVGTPEDQKSDKKTKMPTKSKPEDQKPSEKYDAVAESLMRETAQRLEVENKRKPPLETERGPFVEDRIAEEMPQKRREKLALDQKMEEERTEVAKEAELYKVMDDVKHKPKKSKESGVTKLCDHDDVFCGVEQFDDVKRGETQRLAAPMAEEVEGKTTQVFTAQGQVKPVGLIPKTKRMPTGKGLEKKYSTSAISLDSSQTFADKQPNGRGVSIKLLEAQIESSLKRRNFWLTASVFSRPKRPFYADLHEYIRSRNAKPDWTLIEDDDVASKTQMIIQKDPLEVFEQKEPKPAVEMKEPITNFCHLIEPTDEVPFEDPVLGVPLIAKGKKITYGGDCKGEEGGGEKDGKRGKDEEKESCPPKPVCKEKQDVVIEEPCSEKKPLCCYNPKKRILETDLTDKCNAKCAVAPQKPPPLIDCSICRKYETLEDDVPKAKPMVCKAKKCGKPPPKCPSSDTPACSKSPPKRPDLCAGPCSKSEGEKPKAKAKLAGRTSPCSKQQCPQQKCSKKEKPKGVCPSMPKACAQSPPKEKPAKECKKKTCPTINTASKMEEAKKKEKEAEMKKEREKKCKPKGKKCEVDTCKVLSDCEKKKLKAEEDRKKAEEEAALKEKTIDPKLHSEWKTVQIKGPEKWCNKGGAEQQKKTATSTTVNPNTEKKYQSPRYERKSGESKPGGGKNAPQNTKKCLPIGVMDVSQSLAVIETSLYHNDVLSESDEGNNKGGRGKKGLEVPPPAPVEKSKSDGNIS